MATQMTEVVTDSEDTELCEKNWSLHWNSAILNSLLEDSDTHDVIFKTSDGGSVSVIG